MTGSPSALRVLNDRAALDVLLEHPTVSRSQLEELVGLSKPATTQLLTRLEEAGLVERLGHRQVGPGPRAQLWGLRANAGFAAGVDVTRLGIDVEIVDLRGTRRAVHHQPATDGDPAVALLAALDTACRSAGIAVPDLAHVVVGTPGSVDPATGHLRYAGDLPDWVGTDLLTSVGAVLPVPFTIENDVNLVALDELTHGKARGARDVVLLWVSDVSVGSSVVVNGELVRGATLGAGEIGFTLVPDLARRGNLPGGHRFGDLVTEKAVLALAAAHGIRATNAIDAVKQGVAGDEDFVTDLARRLTSALVAVVSLLDPELVVLGGSLCSTGGPVLRSHVAAALSELVAPEVVLVTARPEADSVRIGAVQAALVPARERHFAGGSTRPVPGS